LYRLSTFVNRHRVAVSLATVVMATILGSLGFAVVQMREARAQRDAALFQVKRAEASLQLTSFLVGEARVRPGDSAIAERLKKSRELIRRQFAAEPSVRAELLFEIADKFAELRDLKTLSDVMAEIEVLARDTDLPWLHARYRCATAELKMNEGESEAAGVLMHDAFVQLERQRPPQFAAMVECLIDDAYLASLTGDSRRAIERGLQAARLHEERGLTNTNTYAEAWSGLTTAYSFAGDVRKALAATRKARDTYTRLGQDDTFSHLTSLFLEATFLNRGGRRMEALARSNDLLERSRARGLPDNYTQLVYHGIILLGTGQPRAALELFDRSAREFVQQKMRFDELQVHIWSTDALLQLGEVQAGPHASGTTLAGYRRADCGEETRP
jgi:tetratricopeptide (TPR) repeat protein